MAFILIVDDSDDIAPLEIALGSNGGPGVMVLKDGRRALKLLETDPPDLAAVITDLHLPFVDGFDLVAAIRANSRFERLPIIVISGDNDPQVRRRVRAFGADAFFAKPYSPAEVREVLEGLLYAP
ncbi:MAG TPA: response regulator [Bryobacteraceae bacterium]|jgi:CheY-like chemotaxis protein|nr:response regulator [Bryobacteraceae bacterium]